MRTLISVLAFTCCTTLALAQERQWSLDASDREAYLVFGVPETDDVGLSFWCEIGTGKISIYEPVSHKLLKRDKKIRIDLSVDDQKFNIVAKATYSAETQSASLEAMVDVDGTVMAAVQRAQTIGVKALGHKSNYPLFDADVGGLLRVCSSSTTD